MRRRDSKPVPLAVRHRRDWRRWWRHCRCGGRWPCVDRGPNGIDEGSYPPALATAAIDGGPPVTVDGPARADADNDGPDWRGRPEAEALAHQTRAREVRSLIRGGRW